MTTRFESGGYKLPADEDRGGSPSPERAPRPFDSGDAVRIKAGFVDSKNPLRPEDALGVWMFQGYPEDPGMAYLYNAKTGDARMVPIDAIEKTDAPVPTPDSTPLPAEVQDVLPLEDLERAFDQMFLSDEAGLDEARTRGPEAIRAFLREKAAQYTKRFRETYVDFEFPDEHGVIQTWQPEAVLSGDQTFADYRPKFFVIMRRFDNGVIRMQSVDQRDFRKRLVSFRTPEDAPEFSIDV